MLASGGPDNIKARLLASRCAVSVGTIYNLFGDLDELKRQLVEDLVAELATAIAHEENEMPTEGVRPLDRLLRLSRLYIDEVARDLVTWAGCFDIAQRVPIRAWHQDGHLAQLMTGPIAAFPGAASPTRRQIAAEAAWSTIYGMVIAAIINRELPHQKQAVRTRMELTLRALAGSLASPPFSVTS